MSEVEPVSFSDGFEALEFLPDRTPGTTDAERAAAFARLADYRDGGIFIGHWAGRSPWERHRVGDEIVMVVEGATTIILLDRDGPDGDRQVPISLSAGSMVIVPRGTWHRFDTPEGVKVMTVTPQPTEHLSTDEVPPADDS